MEPTKKTEEQLERVFKEVELYNRSKKNRLVLLEGVQMNAENGDVAIDTEVFDLAYLKDIQLKKERDREPEDLIEPEYQIDMRRDLLKK